MSEIKGQMLGMILTLLIFSLVGGILYASFQDSSAELNDKITHETSFVPEDGQ